MFSFLHLQSKEICPDTIGPLICISLEPDSKVKLGFCLPLEATEIFYCVSQLSTSYTKSESHFPQGMPARATFHFYVYLLGLKSPRDKISRSAEVFANRIWLEYFFPGGNLGFDPINMEIFWFLYPLSMFSQSHENPIPSWIIYFLILSSMVLWSYITSS